MKIKQLNQKYPAIEKVYNSGVKEFKRKLELRKGFKELKEILQQAEESQQEIVKEYADESGKVPEGFQNEVNQEIQQIMDTEVEVDHPLKFTEKEFEEAAKKDLTSSELAEIYDEFSKDGEDAD
jgi:hypothetical protein